jgi:PHD/YefM family antitoxin component YafN of YafNO toxin-antitoxin module
MEQVINLKEAQARLPQILTEIGQAEQEMVIQRDNRPVAVLISYQQYQEWLTLREQAQARLANFAVYDEIRARNAAARPEQVEADVAAAIRAVRSKRS